ncbi:uncharacterized protein LOC120380378 [Mauremys reevesii]|uniref:uncharacterized protein LOC120380378 n=1 Tax=Mauremys reevesii TaxID=260615 RepID=UPI00193FEDE8|nr:uncharacterized protein LOC120380378 [Mauremys reevesii]XP_039354014.1 uncharacterized protein LOC120380378 [Mauremys reevesii]XP_039354015.1 uncharacterized protein LOC120380378 [Mauremys reevesii]XP_039354016.1 uncharacterized protein LOC120380378 [Mauremys reevesii]XP_039354017.1 uncharacterized protein LOC120380378 [Mauremys reevesii]XP_039354018.1 uncharacterized protein LOC120380378 [Mauremys reevesii]XP_039354019.1 uncharacterized protein LOC120380378 [Mauremys reevesii]XP_03935402
MARSERSSVDWTPVNGSLVPHKDAPGTDVFCNRGGVFIVRSDLGCYLQTKELKTGTGIEIRRLHPACQGGDHYLSDIKDPPNIYIIKGDSYRVVKDLSTDAGATVRELHPSCRGGDHYMYRGSLLQIFGNVYELPSVYDIFFCVIFLERGVMHQVYDLTTDEKGKDVPLKPELQKGLYYFGYVPCIALIQVDKKWGVQCYLYGDINSAPRDIFSIHPNVLIFFPGGLTFTHGTLTGSWECIKTLHNDSDSPITWSDKVTCKVGYANQQMSSIEHNWSISAEMSLKAGALTKLITKCEFSLKAEYGGKIIHTKQEDWNEAREEEESIQVTLEPKKNLYIWQYRLCMGQEPVLFCRDIQFTKEHNPPDRIPLPPVP